MTTAALTDIDLKTRDAVIHQLDWDPEVDASGIGVAAKDGAVTLTGFIDTYGGKLAAERAAKRVAGVRAVANDLQVRLKLARTDEEIARDVARALELRSVLPPGVQGVVHGGHVTLTGKVSWLFQRVAAEKAIHDVRGIVGMVNRIEVVPTASASDVRRRITTALHNIADLDARHVQVTADKGVVTLKGEVKSWYQRDVAERAASAAPGITRVENQITVVPFER